MNENEKNKNKINTHSVMSRHMRRPGSGDGVARPTAAAAAAAEEDDDDDDDDDDDAAGVKSDTAGGGAPSTSACAAGDGGSLPLPYKSAAPADTAAGAASPYTPPPSS